jgi:hypothetical protein
MSNDNQIILKSKEKLSLEEKLCLFLQYFLV